MILKEKVAIVTGAARGLGWGIARALGLAGAKVCICDINTEELARAEHDRKDASDVISLPWMCKPSVNLKVSLIRWLTAGAADGIVQNGFLCLLIQFEETSEESWWHQLHISLGGIFNATCALGMFISLKGRTSSVLPVDQAFEDSSEK